MYYPYLRGRQNELLAVKELLQNSKLSTRIIPIIEPVKLSPTLVNTLEALVCAQRKVAFIWNPAVGSFGTDAKNPKNSGYLEKLGMILQENEEILRTVIMGVSVPPKIDRWLSEGIDPVRMISLCLDADNIKYHELAFREEQPYRTIVPYAPAFRRIRHNRVLLDDKFNKKLRNKDYADDEDEFFSDDHLYFENDNYVGFSDYSIVGDEYSESGFAPYAVAIHIVYFDQEKNLRIHHFTSTDNDDIADPAGKFYQALTKLVEWNSRMHLDTIAMKQFEEIYEKQTYPGLGVIKRLSIMHHLELVGRYLDGEQI